MSAKSGIATVSETRDPAQFGRAAERLGRRFEQPAHLGVRAPRRVVHQLVDRAGLPRPLEHRRERVGAEARLEEREQVMRRHAGEVPIRDLVGSRHESNIGRFGEN